MNHAHRRNAAALALSAVACISLAAPLRADGPQSEDESSGRIVALLGPAGGAEPSETERARSVTSLAKDFRWTELVLAWSRTSDPVRADILLDAVAATPAEARAEFFAIAAQPEVRRFLRSAALGVVRRAPESVDMDAVMKIAAAIPESDRARPFTTGALRDAIAARLRRAPRDLTPLRKAWTTLDESLRDACLDGIEAAGRHGGTLALSTILVESRSTDPTALARLALSPLRSAEPWAAGTQDLVRAAIASDDAMVRRCGVRVAGRMGGTEHVARLVDLLGDAEVGGDAQGALHSITGFDILADQDLWTTRIAEENQWALESWPAEREALADAAAPDAQLAAIARIAERRMHAAHIAPILAPLVRDGTPDVRLAAARVLGAFGRPSSIPVLADVVLDPEVRVAAAASESLARITGLTAPARAGDWLDELAL